MTKEQAQQEIESLTPKADAAWKVYKEQKEICEKLAQKWSDSYNRITELSQFITLLESK